LASHLPGLSNRSEPVMTVNESGSAIGEREPALETTRILIVDPYSHSRDGLSDSLRAAGYRVDSAAGSWEAVQKAKDAPFELAIIDLDLPPAHGVIMSGWELARIVRAFNPGAALILITAEWCPELRLRADALHRARLLEKPIHPGELRGLVKALECEGVKPSTLPPALSSSQRF